MLEIFLVSTACYIVSRNKMPPTARSIYCACGSLTDRIDLTANRKLLLSKAGGAIRVIAKLNKWRSTFKLHSLVSQFQNVICIYKKLTYTLVLNKMYRMKSANKTKTGYNNLQRNLHS